MYSGIDDPRRWILQLALEEHALKRPRQPLVSIIGGESVTFAELNHQVGLVAGFLQHLGISAGDRVALLLPNDLDLVRAWLGLGRLGAVAVMINTELSKSFLAHPLQDSAPRALVIHHSFLDRLEEIATTLPNIRTILVVGESAGESFQSFDAWRDAAPTTSALPTAQDPACIMYTSGTTGAPKGVVMPHAHCFLFGLGVVENVGLSARDHYYIALPLFHANGLLMQLGATIIAGAQATIRPRFSASSWLPDVQACGATVTNTLGAISAFVIAQPPTSQDREHRLRLILAAPNLPEHERTWRQRFGIREVIGAYGMTEVNIPIYGERSKSRPGTCGRVYSKYFDVEIRDPLTDAPVSKGEVGEIMVRPRIPNGFMSGYFNAPDKTVEAWRNLWFHTGDAGHVSGDGYITFVDRIKDCIRRRGENISAVDIETTLAALPGVAEVAAFPVPSEIDGGEDEIMLAIVPSPEVQLTADAIANHAREHIPRFAWPRYVEFKSSLPKTGTEKIRKVELRQAGVTGDTIDLQTYY